MNIKKLAIPEVLLITPRRFSDDRGFFSETWNEQSLSALGFQQRFVQDNHSLSVSTGTIRGLHCQLAPYAQGKLVRAVRGALLDVAVDIRHGSPSFGHHVAVTLSAENWQQLWIPPGFLHGFCTLEPNTEVSYKVTAPYDRQAERGVRWDDPTLAIPWPVQPENALLSEKDQVLPQLRDCDPWFQI